MGSEVYIATGFRPSLSLFSSFLIKSPRLPSTTKKISVPPFRRFSCREPTFACILNFRDFLTSGGGGSVAFLSPPDLDL